ncbi:MAG TPA: ATP-dependent Clp protease proteolytic subunit [Mucilaginibacter sp.]
MSSNIDKNEFRKYAVKHHRLNGLNVDRFIAGVERSATPSGIVTNGGITGMTPYIIEERQLNISQLDVFSRLMMDRIIFMGEAIYESMANVIQAQLLFLQSADNKRDIQIYINSPGGSVYAGLGIYDTMQLISNDVGTICTGMAASMAAVLLVAGTEGKRSALPHSRVMIHQPSGGAQGQQSDIEITYNEITKLKKELYQIIADHSGAPYQKVWDASDRDYWMTAEEAKEFGMVDEILRGNKTKKS